MCLLGSIALFNHALLKKPSKATDDQIGLVLGMGLVAFQLYVCADINIGDKIIGSEQVKEKAEGISQYVSSNFKNQEVDKKAKWSRTKALMKLFAIIIFFLIIVNAVIGSLDPDLFDTLINKAQYEQMAKVYMYGNIVILIFCVFLYYSRTKF